MANKMNEEQQEFINELKYSNGKIGIAAARSLRSAWSDLDQANKRIEDLESQLKEAQIKGFKDGWETSGEGYNTEFGDCGDDVVGSYAEEINKGDK